MSVTAAALRKLAMLNLSAEQMAGVLDILADGAEADEMRRSGQRDRTRKHRAKRDGNVTVTLPECYTVSPKKEIPPTPPKEKTTPSSSEASASSLNPRGELEIVLDAERAKAVIDHRQRIRKPLTAYAARQLATKLAQCPDPNAAADEMISNGWQGFKPEWLRPSPQNRATAPPPGQDFNSILDSLQGKPRDDEFTTTVDASVNRTDRGSPANLVQLHALPARR